MCFLIALLFLVNICGTMVIFPHMLINFLLRASHISLTLCLTQMFLLYFVLMLECNILLNMSYADIVTRKLLVVLILVGLVCSMAVVSPVVILAS